MNIIQSCRQFFPSEEIANLYPYQEAAIHQLTAGENTLCIVPTGGGKSLVYQLAGLILQGITIVVSPLKALMQEQVEYLKSKGIEACSLSSDLGFQEQRDMLRKLHAMRIQFLYVSPERLHNYFFRAALVNSRLDIKQVVIDESHCISQWGQDFRPEYGEIMSFVEFLRLNGSRPVISCLSATMSTKAIDDINREFGITTEPITSAEGSYRPELILKKQEVAETKNKDEKWKVVVDFLKDYNSRKAIIYLYSKKKCEELASRFNDEKPIDDSDAGFFHAGMTEADKLVTYKKFKSGEINFLFATTAFGMGMNISDIDCVIQYHLPKSIEEYYQQVGRGARNKALVPQCYCLLLWNKKNIDSNIKEIEKERCSPEKIDRAIEQLNLNVGVGKTTSIGFSEYQNANINLPKFKFHFERLGLIKTLGEINGGPNSIKFKVETEAWKEIRAKSKGNSFIIASRLLGRPVQSLVNYVYQQDLAGNVKYLPAMDRTLFIEKVSADFDAEKDGIIRDINSKVDFQLERFDILKELCVADDANEFIRAVFAKHD